MQVLKSQQDVCCVESRRVLLESTNLGEVKEELPTWAILKTEEKFVFRLERVVHLHNERVVDTLLGQGSQS